MTGDWGSITGLRMGVVDLLPERLGPECVLLSHT